MAGKRVELTDSAIEKVAGGVSYADGDGTFWYLRRGDSDYYNYTFTDYDAVFNIVKKVNDPSVKPSVNDDNIIAALKAAGLIVPITAVNKEEIINNK